MSIASPQTRTEQAAVINGDVVGYSRLIADNEIETHQTLQTFRRIIDEAVGAENGELVTFVGDEFLAVVPSNAGALAAAITIQRNLAAENERLPVARQMRFRLGVNAGLVSVENGRWFGDVINVAARLQALAKPGGIWASAAALDGADKLPVRLRSLGPKRLKHIPEPVLAYELVDEELPMEDERPWRRRIPSPKRPSLALSPFVNLGDPADEHFAVGLMLAVAGKLKTIPGLDLLSRGSVSDDKDRAYSAQQIGYELGVRYVLEGAVQRSGSRVRVHTQLVEAEHSAIVWADRFEAELSDVFAAQDALVARIVEALDLKIGGELAHSYREALSAESVEIAYRGLHELAKGTPDSLQRASGHFETLIEREPDSPLGYSLAAWAYLWAVLRGAPDDADSRSARARQLAERAVELHDRSGLGSTVLAHLLVLEHDWDGAHAAASRATAERPSCDLSFGVAASVMCHLGRWEEAVELASRAIHLSPLMSDWYRTVLANAYFIGEDYELAAESAEAVVAEDETNTEALLTLAAAQAALGRRRYAAAALKQARETAPGLSAERLRRELPSRDGSVKERFIEYLQEAGLH